MNDEAGSGAVPRPWAVLLRWAGDMIAWHGSQQEATVRNCPLLGMKPSSHGYRPCAGVSRQTAMRDGGERPEARAQNNNAVEYGFPYRV